MFSNALHYFPLFPGKYSKYATDPNYVYVYTNEIRYIIINKIPAKKLNIKILP